MRRIAVLMILTVVSANSGMWGAGLPRRAGHDRGARPIPPPWTRRSLIQIAVILDTGPNMSGLIHQAKTEIWSIVNEMAFASRGQMPSIVQVAVLTHGGSYGPSRYGNTRVLIPFTTNYYAVFRRLDSLRTSSSGGDNHARSVEVALRVLEWSPYSEDLKVIFVAGDGRFSSAQHGAAGACGAAVEAGVVVNTAYCGPSKLGIAKNWAQAAYCTGGQYVGINQVRRAAYKQTPVDRQVLDLNEQLNETYRFDADRWDNLWKEQRDKDRDVTIASKEAAVQRVITKAAKGLLMNSTYALLHEETGTWGLEPEIRLVDLPAATTEAELSQFLEQERSRREIEEQILELAGRRQSYLRAGKSTGGSRPTLGQALIQAVREQAYAKGFKFFRPDEFVTRDPEAAGVQ